MFDQEFNDLLLSQDWGFSGEDLDFLREKPDPMLEVKIERWLKGHIEPEDIHEVFTFAKNQFLIFAKLIVNARSKKQKRKNGNEMVSEDLAFWHMESRKYGGLLLKAKGMKMSPGV
jgi:hypothetical protein